MTVVIYSRASSGQIAPAYIPGTSTALFAGNASAKWYTGASVALAAGDTTWRANTAYTSGDVVANWSGGNSRISDVRVEADGSITSAGTVFDNTIINYSFYIISGTSINTGQWYVVYVNTTTHAAYLSRTLGGAIASAGTFTGTADGVLLYARNTAGASGSYYECITSGTSGTTGGPTGQSSNITDGTAHWKFLATDLGANSTSVKRVYPLQDTYGVTPFNQALVTGKGGAGLAARIVYNNATTAITDFHIDAGDSQWFTSAQMTALINAGQYGSPGTMGMGSAPGGTGGNDYIVISSGTGFTPGTYYIRGSDAAGRMRVASNAGPAAPIFVSMGATNSTNGVGVCTYAQQGNDFKSVGISVPPSTATVEWSMQVRMTGDGSYYASNGNQIKWMRMDYTGGGQLPQGSTQSWAGYPTWCYVPCGYVDSYSGSFSNMTVDSVDNRIVTFESSGVQVFGGAKVILTGGGGFTGGTYYASYATSNILSSGGRSCKFWLHSGSPTGPIVSVAAINTSGGSGTYSDLGAYPAAKDVGLSPLVHFSTYVDSAWHLFSWRYRAHSAPDVFDGTWQMWIDGSLAVWVAQAAVGVTPPGGVKQWCSLGVLMNHPIQQGVGTQVMSIGGVQTLPSPNTSLLYVDANIGTAGDITDTDTMRAWYNA